MSEAKIEVKVGEFSFSGTGDPQWVAAQFDKVLSKAQSIVELTNKIQPPIRQQENENPRGNNSGSPANDTGASNKSLASYLKDKNATVNQNQKFLATAAWLAEAKGKGRITTADVNTALKTASQSRLGNASECLNQNIKKGYLEKDGSKEFYVTEEGRMALGA